MWGVLEIPETTNSDNELNRVLGWILCLEPSSKILVKLILGSKKNLRKNLGILCIRLVNSVLWLSPRKQKEEITVVFPFKMHFENKFSSVKCNGFNEIVLQILLSWESNPVIPALNNVAVAYSLWYFTTQPRNAAQLLFFDTIFLF